MLDGLLGRGFGPKCKSLIKLTKSRIDVIRRKRNATQKFLKKDVADLLSNGHDINAYSRAEGLLSELNVSFGYDFVEQCCNFVLKHLSIIQKQRDCPEDCREAISSLMFAAARFSDLPELRNLRHMFQERYGNSLEYFVNPELVEKLASKPATMEKKVQLMQDIASEFSIRWDARDFQQRMSKPSTSARDQPKRYGSFNISNDKYKPVNGNTIPNHDKNGVSYKDGLECTSNGHRLNNVKEDTKRDEHVLHSRHALAGDGLKPRNGREESSLKIDEHDFSLQGRRKEVVNGKHEAADGKEDTALKTVRLGSSVSAKKMEYNDGTPFRPHAGGGRENAAPKRESKDSLPYNGNPSIAPSYAGKHLKSNGNDMLDSDHCHGQHNIASSTKTIHEEEIPKLKSYYNNALPPPYVKSDVKVKDGKHGANLVPSHPGFDTNGVSKDSSLNFRANVGDTSERIRTESEHRQQEQHTVRYTELYYKGNDDVGNPIPKPRSSRRRHSKPPSGPDDSVGEVGTVKRKSRSRRRDDSKRGLQILVEDEHYKDKEEERIIDKLLMHYSKKPSTCEEGTVRRRSKSRHAYREGEGPQNLRRDGSHEMSEMVPPPARSISLPHEQSTSSETTKVFTRAASFQPDRSNAARHVHPKLPDYDDLAAQFAALKGR